ncbi:MAG: hypothetical protein IH587_04885 [Anaerolineae bacterium]|nr:hypothetical protein [Anaerolineae bacterium]
MRHTLALTQIAQHDFDAAAENLAEVGEIWRRLQYPYSQADVCVAWSYLERERGRKLQAREWLVRAKEICDDIENDRLREQMLAMIRGESGKLDD